MKFERIKNNKKKLIGVIAFLIIGVTIVIATSLAAYKTTKSIPIAKGDVNYIIPDMKIVAIQIYPAEGGGEWISSDTIPSGDEYFLDSDSHCEYYDQENNEMVETGTIKYQNGNLTIEGLLHKNSKCYLYFMPYSEYGTISISDIIATAEIDVRENFSDSYSEVTTNKLFEAQDNDGTTYYYAGNPTDNYLRFAGYNWRIIRINGDGSLRIMMEDYVDYAYIYSLDNAGGLYEYEYLLDLSGIINSEYMQYVTSSKYCGDSYDSSSTSANVVLADCGENIVSTSCDSLVDEKEYYSAYERVINGAPSLECDDSNQAILITVDEVMYAGGYGSYISKNNPYLTYNYSYEWNVMLNYGCEDCTGETEYCYCRDKSWYASELYAYAVNNGSIISTTEGLLYPVISLSPDIQLFGDGTKNNPYIVVGLSE